MDIHFKNLLKCEFFQKNKRRTKTIDILRFT